MKRAASLSFSVASCQQGGVNAPLTDQVAKNPTQDSKTKLALSARITRRL
jgi:hypothetical protein